MKFGWVTKKLKQNMPGGCFAPLPTPLPPHTLGGLGLIYIYNYTIHAKHKLNTFAFILFTFSITLKLSPHLLIVTRNE